MTLFLGVILAILIALGAYRLKALSLSGAWAAGILGTIIFGLGGLGWAILLLAFFISSSALSRLLHRRKQSLNEKFSKGSQRDAGQVLANGGIAGLCVLLHLLLPQSALPWIAFAAALAAANADTWATEMGVLSAATPRLITTGKPVERGTSGGITLVGTLSSLSGAALIALFGVFFWQGHILTLSSALPEWLRISLGAGIPRLPFLPALLTFGMITLAGALGSLFDSWLGATIQAIYYCPTCQKETERFPLHTCGTNTHLLRGLPWMDNDWVNGLCTLLGAILAALFWILL